MAKYVHQATLKGDFSFLDMEIVETSKESIDTYDLKEILKQFDGRTVSITIKEEEPISPKVDE